MRYHSRQSSICYSQKQTKTEKRAIMAIYKNSDGNQMILICSCGCDEGLRVNIEHDDDIYCYQTYLSGNWYREQGRFLDKLKKIWRIIRNKDYYYSEICLTKEDWEKYKEWVNTH